MNTTTITTTITHPHQQNNFPAEQNYARAAPREVYSPTREVYSPTREVYSPSREVYHSPSRITRTVYSPTRVIEYNNEPVYQHQQAPMNAYTAGLPATEFHASPIQRDTTTFVPVKTTIYEPVESTVYEPANQTNVQAQAPVYRNPPTYEVHNPVPATEPMRTYSPSRQEPLYNNGYDGYDGPTITTTTTIYQ